MNTKIAGKQAEQYVAHMLTEKGYTICANNYQKQFGEVDIIARKDDVISFVEVKLRRNPLFDVTTIITRSKQKKMIAVAKYFMAKHNLVELTVQFDVAFVSQVHDRFESEYIANAFQE